MNIKKSSTPDLMPNAWRCAASCVIAMIAFLVMAPQADACQIPVFRYALERWNADDFTAVVFHDGPLSEAQDALIQRLRDANTDANHPLNLKVETADTRLPMDPLNKLMLEHFGTPESYPAMMVRFPQTVKTDELAFRGPLDGATVEGLIDSPARQEIADRILDGQSAVWVLIESEDEDANDMAEARLQTELTRLEESLELPTEDDLRNDEYFMETTTVDLRLEFSIIRINPNDPVEKAHAEILMGSEPGLREIVDPVVIPVFGRGRSYFALAGRGISPVQIESNAKFLTGACSCQVKEENPGADLLMAVNWDARVTGSVIPDKPLPELSSLGLLDLAPASDTPADLGEGGGESESMLPTGSTTSATSVMTAPLIGLVVLVIVAVGAGSIFVKSSRQE